MCQCQKYQGVNKGRYLVASLLAPPPLPRLWWFLRLLFPPEPLALSTSPLLLLFPRDGFGLGFGPILIEKTRNWSLLECYSTMKSRLRSVSSDRSDSVVDCLKWHALTHVGHLALPKQLILMLSKDRHEKAKLKYDSEEDNDCIIYVMNIFSHYIL